MARGFASAERYSRDCLTSKPIAKGFCRHHSGRMPEMWGSVDVIVSTRHQAACSLSRLFQTWNTSVPYARTDRGRGLQT